MRNVWITGAAILAGLAALTSGTAQAQTAQAEHWGAYFGNHKSSEENTTPTPVPVNLPAPVTQGGSAAGNGQTLVMLADGSVFGWGSDFSSQLGDGKTGIKTAPERITPPAGVTYSLLATGA
jgi:hypothetical protein